jgi:cytochrome P450 family 3 subfamily A
VIIINDPELIKDVMIKDFHVFNNHRYYHFGEIFDLSIVNSHNDNWKRIRSIVSPSFTSSKLVNGENPRRGGWRCSRTRTSMCYTSLD